MDNCLKKLKENKLKITPKRMAVMELFSTSRKCLKPREVYKAIKKKIKPLGLPTIYRILDEFCKIGLIRRLQTDDGQFAYAFCVSQEKHLHYFVCRNCSKVQEIETCNIKNIARHIEKMYGAKVEAHQLQIEGTCSDCK